MGSKSKILVYFCTCIPQRVQGHIAQYSLNHHTRKKSKLPLLGLQPKLGAGFPYLEVACGEPREVWRKSAPLSLEVETY
jgi:hypothetical protein